MTNQILNDVKEYLLIDTADFDQALVLHINGVISDLFPIGIVAAGSYTVTVDTGTWSDLIGTHPNPSAIKTFVFASVKLAFDAPTLPHLVNAIKDQIEKTKFYIQIDVVPPVAE